MPERKDSVPNVLSKIAEARGLGQEFPLFSLPQSRDYSLSEEGSYDFSEEDIDSFPSTLVNEVKFEVVEDDDEKLSFWEDWTSEDWSEKDYVLPADRMNAGENDLLQEVTVDEIPEDAYFCPDCQRWYLAGEKAHQEEVEAAEASAPESSLNYTELPSVSSTLSRVTRFLRKILDAVDEF